MTLTDLNAWKELEKNYADVRGLTMRDMFKADPSRFEEFSVSLDNLLLDYSKNRITKETMKLLIDLYTEGKVVEKDEAKAQEWQARLDELKKKRTEEIPGYVSPV